MQGVSRYRRALITGIGVVSPVGIGVTAFWKNLLQGKSPFGQIKAFDASGFPVHYAAEIMDDSYTDHAQQEDAKDSGKAHAMAVSAIGLAVRDAGLAPSAQENIPIIAGSSIWPGVGLSAASEMFSGTVSTACTSGINAVGLAFQSIQNGSTDICIAGGVDAPVTESILKEFCNAGRLSLNNIQPSTLVRPFDAERSGTLLGEGAGFLILESAQSAIDRGARIYCEISKFAMGTERKNDLFNSERSARNWAEVLQEVSRERRSKPVSINAHAAGDRNTDWIEAQAIQTAFTGKEATVYSIKGSVGSALAGGGGLQMAATACSIANQMQPGTTNCEQVDPAFKGMNVSMKPSRKAIESAIVNSYAYGGTTAAILMERFRF